MRNTNKAVCESAREKRMISSIYSRAAIVPHCLKLGTTAVRLPNNPLIKEGPPCLSVDFRAVPVNYRTHNIWNLFQIFLKHAYYYHSYSCGLIPSFGYCINIVLTCTLHRFNVKYYNLQCWCKQSLWLSFTLCDLVSLLLYFPLDVGLSVSVQQFDPGTFGFQPCVVCGATTVKSSLKLLQGPSEQPAYANQKIFTNNMSVGWKISSNHVKSSFIHFVYF